MSHKFESGFFLTPAWHGLGKILDNPPTIEQAIIDAGLDWIVEEQPIYQQLDDGYVPILGHKSLVRSTDKKVLGIVSDMYKPLQNQDAFGWFNFLLHENNISFEAAGSLKGGRRVWILAKINESTLDVDNGDVVNPYLLLSNSHDGSTAVWVQFSAIRVVCNNTLSLALSSRYKDEARGKAIRIRHSSSIKEQLSIAQNALDFARQRFQYSVEEYRKMAKKSISKDLFEDYVGYVLDTDTPTSTRAYPKIEANFLQGRGNAGVSLWHGFNAIAEWLDYQRGRTQESRLDSTWFGDSAKIREKAHQAAVCML